MFDTTKLKELIGQFKSLDAGIVNAVKGDEEDVNILVCTAKKADVGSLEKFYALVVKIDRSYAGTMDAEEDFNEFLMEGEFRQGSYEEVLRSVGSWGGIDLTEVQDKLASISNSANVCIVNDCDGESEFLIDADENYIFIGISIY